MLAITVHHASETVAHCTKEREFLLWVAVAAIVFLAQVVAFSTSITVLVWLAALVAHSKRWWWWRWCRWWWRCGRWCRWWWCRWGSGWRWPAQVEGGEGRHPQGHDSAPSCRWWWREKMVKWARWAWRWWSRGSVHLSQFDLAGSCPLVAPGPPSCTAVSASTTSCLVTRSWWRGWRTWKSCRRRWWSLKGELEGRLASTGREWQGSTSTFLLHLTE